MKYINIKSALIASLFFLMALSGCKTSTPKPANNQAVLLDASHFLRDVRQEAIAEKQKNSNADNWITFKKETDFKISLNESIILDLRTNLISTGKALNALYIRKINLLDNKNKNLKQRLVEFEENQTKFKEFKQEFTYDMEKLEYNLSALASNIPK